MVLVRSTRKQLTSRPDHLWPELWKSMGKHAKLKEKQKWSHEKSSILITHENWEGSTSLTPRIRNSKKPSRTLVRSWKHQWLLLCLVNHEKLWEWCIPTKFKQNLRVFWKLMNLQECVWEIRYRKYHIAGKGENSFQHYNFVHKFFPMPQAVKILEAKAAVRRGT